MILKIGQKTLRFLKSGAACRRQGIKIKEVCLEAVEALQDELLPERSPDKRLSLKRPPPKGRPFF
jgi:hypothetical protein